MEQRSDEELLAAHLAGDASTFEILVTRYADDLFSFFSRYVGNSAAADDLVQETFLQVHLSGSAFDPERSFKPWLYTIAANKARDYMRARSRRATQSLDAQADADAPSPANLLETDEHAAADQFERSETQQQVRDLIAQMPEQQRLILMLGYYQRLPYADIATVLGVPVGTVKSRLHTAITQFARLWQAHRNRDT